MSNDSCISKYLENYAEKTTSLLLPLTSKHWDNVITVPFCNEFELVPGLIQSLENAAFFSQKNILFIAVVNGKTNEDICQTETNQRLLSWFRAYNGILEITVIDRATSEKRFSEKEGVGLARKIGCDWALALIARGQVSSPLIFCTDADARVPEDFFNISVTEIGISALHCGYRHSAELSPNLEKAHILYELSLRYYVLGLRFSRSPYAFPTIGSTIIIHSLAYASVRGFPKREAGEDFYLLNKLAKVGKILPSGKNITLIARISSRVPFGTGAGSKKIMDTLNKGEPILFYAPETFSVLQVLIKEMQLFSEHRTVSLFERSFTQKMRATFGESLSDKIDLILKQMKISVMLSHALSTRKDPTNLLNHLQTTFDAFKTLKFTHLLRDHVFPLREFQNVLETAAFLSITRKHPKELLEELIRQEEAGFRELSSMVS